MLNEHPSNLLCAIVNFSNISPCSDPYADPYYDYEMEALWRGGQYENFRVQYTEAPLPYPYTVSRVLSL